MPLLSCFGEALFLFLFLVIVVVEEFVKKKSRGDGC